MANVALFTTVAGVTAFAELDFAATSLIYVGVQVYQTTAQNSIETGPYAALELDGDSGHSDGLNVDTGDGTVFGFNDFTTPAGAFVLDAWNTLEMAWNPASPPADACANGTTGDDNEATHVGEKVIDAIVGHITAFSNSGVYIGKVWVGTAIGQHDILEEDWSSGDFSNWTSTTGACSVIASPVTNPPAFTSGLTPVVIPDGRVLIAWDDGPLVANPTWTRIDGGDSPFPQNFVSGYDTHSGRQTLVAQTETGTATVYVNDREGLFDDRNGSSPYQGKLSGRQILLQLYNPVDATWEPEFRGLIDDYRYTIDGTAVGADGNPVNCSIEIDCVDIFDYLNGYGLTPGLDGVTPPVGAEDSVYYPANGVSDTVADRILEILTDAGIDPSMSILGSGSVQVIATQYNADESALTAIRDAADAEFPFIGNVYVNRSGLVCFRGRYSRFAPDDVAAEPSSLWDFTRWKVGDGKAIQADPTRAQMRLFTFSRDRAELINAAICYPQATDPADIPGQVYANTASITAYGKHEVSPLSDLITGKYVGFGTVTPDTGLAQCALYAELLVKNKKDPIFCPTGLQVKAINAQDFRASATWDILTRSDIGDIVNIAVGYPGGTGLMGGATVDDYYIEGRALTVRLANTAYDYVEMDLEVTPYRWSADTHGVFPAFGT